MQIGLPPTPATPIPGARPISRALLIDLVQAAITVKELRFARQAALNWLAAYPGDLPVNLLYAQTLMHSGLPGQALPVLERLCQADPEYREAVDLMVQAEAHVRQEQANEPTRTRRTVLPKTPAISNVPGRRTIKRTEEESSGWLLGLGGSPDLAQARALGLNRSLTKTHVEWSRNLIRARAALQRGDPALAEQELHPVLAIDPNIPLAAALHLRALDADANSGKMPIPALRSLAAHYLERWPALITARLALANAALRSSNPEQGVALMHTAAAADITGQVADRMWGPQHGYQTIWPSDMTLELDVPVPAAVAGVMGWNRLPSLSTASVAEQPAPIEAGASPSEDLLASVQAELERLSNRIGKPHLAKSDGRYPVYVIMTTRKGLVKRYGPQGAAQVENAMRQFAAVVRQRKDYDALLFYADEGVYIQDIEISLGREPVRHTDPWALKLALADLDNSLKKAGERIGAILIVGGPAVVPFHHLPNPVDDADVDVPSDNPYACRDENYFIPEWPLGRLPDGAPRGVSDPEPLVKALEALAQAQQSSARHSQARRKNALLSQSLLQWLERLTQLINLFRRDRTTIAAPARSSLGYTAAIWQQASISVFEPIGEARGMQISPPIGLPQPGSAARQGSPLPPARLAYFNLHGLAETAEWYGQRDPGGPPSNGQDPSDEYPVAVTPQDVRNSGHAPHMVFSEACYGANIINKALEEALAFKFLQSGTQAVVGSTCTAYGSIAEPLIAADFLGHAFWNFVRQGLPAGEALRRAKIGLAQEMHTRQGYLDGEDQKTLISFVLYGDPLAQPVKMTARMRKSLQRLLKYAPRRSSQPPPTVCDKSHDELEAEHISEDTLAFVRTVVTQYLPGMQGADIQISHEHLVCLNPLHSSSRAGKTPGSSGAPGAEGDVLPNRRVITLSKQVQVVRQSVSGRQDAAERPQATSLQHRHYARLTLDAEGRLVKLVVSR
jgi:hypothetical protein